MGEFKNFEELEQAYKALKQEVALLEQEWRQSGVVQEINAIETEFLEEQTANELGVAGITALGIGTLHKIIKLVFTPKAAAPLIGGAWILGGAFIIFHFTGSTMAGWAMMTQRNARRKRVLQTKLEAIQRRFNSLASSLGIEADVGPPGGGGGGGEQQEGLPTRHSSPTHSTGSSAELVEAPTAEEEAEGNVGSAGGAAASTSDSSKKTGSRRYSSFDSLKRYASLGGSRKKDT